MPAANKGGDIYRRLVSYSFSQWPLLLIAILGMLVSAATEPAFAALMRPLLDGSFVERDPTALKWVPVMMLLVFLLRGLSTFVTGYFMARIGRTVIMKLRGEMFHHYLSMPTTFFDNAARGELISRITYNTEQVAEAATNSITVLIRDSLTVIGLLGWMFYLSWEMAVGVLAITPLVSMVAIYVTRQFRRISRKIQSSMGDVTHVAEEMVEGHRVVKVFGGQAYEEERFNRVNTMNRELNIKLAMVKSASSPVVQFLVALVLSGIVVFATRPEFHDKITVGTFMSFMTAMMMLLTPIKRLTDINATIQKGIAAGESIFEVLDAAPEPDNASLVLERPVKGEISFEQVSFRYSNKGEDVLHGIDLKVDAGTTVALVGKSGSGKTTLVNLLPRLYEVTGGTIRLDGTPVSEIRLSDLREHIAYVGQHVTLFNGSIRENIAYGRLAESSLEAVREAAMHAHALEFIEQLPHGFDTQVGENGVLLSGGQRQRLAIARALLKNAPVLILDEATASLDTDAERHIQAALETLSAGRTTLVIAHRLSTVENADRIVVMQQGRTIEQGRHAELLELGGAYSHLYRMQFSDLSD
ncbi:MAG: lipid A export permease/ATP-binding protein MsbA [bacterium]